MNNKLVSIIVPVYGVEKYIVSCLQSICKQEYRNFEIIIVNDGTKDNSIFLAKQFLDSMSNINYTIINKNNGGLSSARNIGLKEASGYYVCFVDSDDTILSNYIDVLIKGFNYANVDMSTASFQLIKKQTNKKIFNNKNNYRIYDREESLECFLFRRIKLAPVCAMFRKEFLIDNNLFFDEKVKFSEDQVFYWNVLNTVKKICVSDTIIYNYYVRDNSITTSPYISKIKTGMIAIADCQNKIMASDELKEFLLARWVFGVLHNTAKYCNYKFFKSLYFELNGDNNLRKLIYFNDKIVRVLARILIFSKFLGYIIFRLK